MHHRLEITLSGKHEGSEFERAGILGDPSVRKAVEELQRTLAASGIDVEVEAKWVKPSEPRRRAAQRPRPAQAEAAE